MSVFNFDFIKAVSRTDILAQFSDSQLYGRYFPDFHIGRCNSPFRVDANPSFTFFDGNGGKVKWKDQKTQETGDVFDFITRIYAQKGIQLTGQSLMERIYTDMTGTEATANSMVERPVSVPVRQRRQTAPKIVQAITPDGGGIPEDQMWYWEQYGITRSVLSMYNVGYALEIYLVRFLNNERSSWQWAVSTPDNPIFFYYFPHSQHMKAYRPLEKDKKAKWLGNVSNSTDIQGLVQCQIGRRPIPLLVLTKSMKEVMFLRTLGIDAIAINGERNLYDATFVTWLKRHCDRIISVYDNDIAGMRGGILLRKLYGIPDYYLPRACGSKDPTDLYRQNYQQLFSFILDLKNHLHGSSN